MRERVKSVVLAALLVLAVGLSFWSLALGVGGPSVFWEDAPAAVSTADGLSELTAAAVPEQLALLAEDGLFLAPAGEEHARVWALVRPFFEEALGSGGPPVAIDERTLSQALRAPAVLLRYDAALPLGLLRVWSDAPAAASELTVRSVVLCMGESGVRLLLRDSGGACYAMETAASSQTLRELCAAEGQANALLARDEPACAALLPEEAIALAAPALTSLRLSPAAQGELARPVLSAFELNPYLANVYQDAEGGTVYVAGRGTLRLTAGGELIYTSSEGGIAVALPEGEDAHTRAARVCAAVYDLFASVWSELGADGTLILDSIGYDEGSDRYTLRFELLRGGLPVDLSTRCWAQAVVTRGAITDATLCPRRIAEEGERVTLLPPLQAAAALAGARGARLSVRWLAGGEDGLLVPAVCRVE